jgi:hypothetical protein
MSDLTLIYGRPISYYEELEQKSQYNATEKELIEEIGKLKGQLSFVEARVQQINQILDWGGK